jgi:methyl-accepting chemotaxis protein-1 (serine sensor receptor)
MKLRLKLPLAFVGAVLIALAAGLAGIYSLRSALQSSGAAVQTSFAQERAVGYLSVVLKAEKVQWKNLLLRADEPELRARHWQLYQAAEREVEQKARLLLPQLDGEAQQLLQRFLVQHEKVGSGYRAALKQLPGAGVGATDASVRGIDDEASALLADTIGKLAARSAAITTAAEQDGARTVNLIAAVMLLVSAGAIGAGIVLSRSIIRPLTEAVGVAQAISRGDLSATVRARTRCEVGDLMRALGDMNASLVRIVSDVRGGTDNIAGASAEIEAGNADLSARTEQQAGALEETAASMEELTATVRQNADNARQASALAAAASDVAGRGGAVVAQVVQTMDAIQAAGRQIGDIIGVMDGIAFQTNILALNAAVEAARAGEQGRGFAVVATEVRSLAQRSHDAAKQVKELIGQSDARVAQGGELAGQAGGTMEEVVASVRRVTDIIGEIAAASQEQRAGIEQVNQAIVQMDRGTQQNAALVEQSAAAASAMREQAGALAQLVQVFKLEAANPLALAHRAQLR